MHGRGLDKLLHVVCHGHHLQQLAVGSWPCILWADVVRGAASACLQQAAGVSAIDITVVNENVLRLARRCTSGCSTAHAWVMVSHLGKCDGPGADCAHSGLADQQDRHQQAGRRH
jgi:hypothetical protein